MITRRPLLSLASALAVWLLTPTAHAQPRLHLQGHAAIAVDGWQSEAFGPGGGAAVTAEYTLAPAVGVTLGGAYSALSQGAISPGRGIAQPGVGGFGTLTAGLRLRPFARRDVGGEGLWLALEGGVGFTGDVARPAYAASLGYGFSVGATVSLGPWVGFTSLVQTDGQDLRDDARLVLAGLSLSLGPASRVAPPPPPPPPPRRCPAILGQALPDADGDGCAEQDRDGDALADALDRCPAEPEDRDGHDDGDGCPDPDNDLDDVLDADDLCPTAAEDKDNWNDGDGCPDPDNDEDGILDGADACPNVAETIDGNADVDGCPEQGARSQVKWQGTQALLDPAVSFPKGSAKPSTELEKKLAMLAQLVRGATPEVVIVEGYADRAGDTSAKAADLAEKRALAVKAAFVTAGIGGDIITAASGDPAAKRAAGAPAFDVTVRKPRPKLQKKPAVSKPPEKN